jgi:hypothetical protein
VCGLPDQPNNTDTQSSDNKIRDTHTSVFNYLCIPHRRLDVQKVQQRKYLVGGLYKPVYIRDSSEDRGDREGEG